MVVFMTVLNGCKEDPLQAYTGGDAVCFWEHAKSYSFYGASTAELPTGIIRVKINIMGYTKPYDRTVAGVALEDAPNTPVDQKRTTASPDEYRILGGSISANSVDGWFEVELKNVDKIAADELKLNVLLTENEHFIPGLKENESIVITWSRALLRPQTWNGMQYFFCATYSSQVYKIYMEITGLREFWYMTAGPDPENNPEDAKISEAMGFVWGRMFGDYIRAYNLEHPDAPMLHDDGTLAGERIIPIF